MSQSNEKMSPEAPERGTNENLRRREEVKMGDRTPDPATDNMPPDEWKKHDKPFERFKQSARRTWRELVHGDFPDHQGPGSEKINAKSAANAKRAAEQKQERQQKAREADQNRQQSQAMDKAIKGQEQRQEQSRKAEDRQQQMRDQIRAKREQSRSPNKGRER